MTCFEASLVARPAAKNCLLLNFHLKFKNERSKLDWFSANVGIIFDFLKHFFYVLESCWTNLSFLCTHMFSSCRKHLEMTYFSTAVPFASCHLVSFKTAQRHLFKRYILLQEFWPPTPPEKAPLKKLQVDSFCSSLNEHTNQSQKAYVGRRWWHTKSDHPASAGNSAWKTGSEACHPFCLNYIKSRTFANDWGSISKDKTSTAGCSPAAAATSWLSCPTTAGMSVSSSRGFVDTAECSGASALII